MQPAEPWLVEAWVAYLDGPVAFRTMCAAIGHPPELLRERFGRYFAARWAIAKSLHKSRVNRARGPQPARQKIPPDAVPALWAAYREQSQTLSALAREHGVAISTVSRALKNRYGAAYRAVAAQRAREVRFPERAA